MPGPIGTSRFVESGVNSAGDPMYSRNLSAGSSDYNSMSKAELEAALEAKGLPKSGNKDELIARLQDG